MRKGQIFTSDFVASFVIFLSVISLAFMALNQATREQTQFNQYNAMRTEAQQVTGLLVRTPGYPQDWNSTNVRIVGFAEPDHMLQQRKLEQFDAIPSYREKRIALGIYDSEFLLEIEANGSVVETAPINDSSSLGEEPIAYIVQASQHMSDYALIDALNRSDLDWELYWPSDNDEDQLDSLTADRVYNYTTSGTDMFDDMVENASDGAYRTIIAENTNVGVSNINETALEQWVADGGTYLHTEERASMLRDTFGFDDVSGSNTGEILAVEPLLNHSLQVGETITWEESLPMAFDDPTTVYVNDTQSPHGCHVCGWTYGTGQVYYVPDTFADTGITTTFTDADRAFTGNLTLRFGRPVPNDAAFVAVTARSVLVNTTQAVRRATMRLILWN